MKRGPNMPQGISFAVPVALRRGHVMVFVPSPRNLAEFLITGNGWFVMVRVRLARKLYAGIPEIEAEFRDAITGLRLVSRCAWVSCELWLYSRYGTLRHFRVTDTGIVEIEWCGTVPVPGTTAGTGNRSVADNAPATGGAAPAGPAAPGAADPRSPILRWLAKWNAARKAGEGAEASGGSGLKKILDSGVPGPKTKPAAGKKPVSKKRSAAAPEVTGKITDPGEPAAGTGPGAGEKIPDGKTRAGIPEENPVPGMNGNIPAPSDSINPGSEGQSPHSQPDPAGAKL
jgi:hypothetical protein